LIWQSIGRMHYDKSRAVLWVDKAIVDYYYSLIPKAKYAQRQKYKPHITVVRTAPIELPPNMDDWGLYQNEKVKFYYSNQIKFDPPYFYLDAWCERIEEIRTELGLNKFRLNQTCYHITIGNTKE